jgi:cell wall-associated NlpC family hydrolase
MGNRYTILLLMLLVACKPSREKLDRIPIDPRAPLPVDTTTDTLVPAATATKPATTGSATREQVVAFAQTLIGTPYEYGCSDPATGFDCSGFITYVFNHFNMQVPRSSFDFTNYGTEVALSAAQPGDLILFTGTDPSVRVVGHMGIIVNNDAEDTSFIHSTSGKENAVTITPLNDHYQKRFVKVISIL